MIFGSVAFIRPPFSWLTCWGIQIVKELSVLRGAFFIPANHPGLRMPRAATSWASCLFAVDGLIIQIKLLIRQQSKLY
nr:MAG TPA: hypothetical protein [Caudoviricetes sp.]